MSLDEYLKEVKERADKATPGPWIHRPGGVVQSQSVPSIIFWDDRPNESDTHESIRPNYAFIAASRTDIEKLIKIVEVQNEGLHKIMRDGTTMDGNWPSAEVAYEIFGQVEKILEGE